MWETYSISSAIRKPRISREEFLDYYQMRETEIPKRVLQEFLDFFEVSEDDLHMRSREEILIVLQGFYLDREAERTSCGTADTFKIEKLQKVEFCCLSGLRQLYGKIDFKKRCLTYCEHTCTFSPSDHSVLLQSLSDLKLMTDVSENGILLVDDSNFFIQIVKTILSRNL